MLIIAKTSFNCEPERKRSCWEGKGDWWGRSSGGWKRGKYLAAYGATRSDERIGEFDLPLKTVRGRGEEKMRGTEIMTQRI